MRTIIILVLLAVAFTLGIATTIDGVHDGRSVAAIVCLLAAALVQIREWFRS